MPEQQGAPADEKPKGPLEALRPKLQVLLVCILLNAHILLFLMTVGACYIASFEKK